MPFVKQKHSRSKIGRNFFTGLKNGHQSEGKSNSSLTPVMKKVEKGEIPSKEVLNTVGVEKIEKVPIIADWAKGTGAHL
jgi:hypothetical protein